MTRRRRWPGGKEPGEPKVCLVAKQRHRSVVALLVGSDSPAEETDFGLAIGADRCRLAALGVDKGPSIFPLS